MADVDLGETRAVEESEDDATDDQIAEQQESTIRYIYTTDILENLEHKHFNIIFYMHTRRHTL